ncbi:MAG: RNA-binding protein [Deltaproteobacteria bacterium]|nr:MAG: RNA-binding protein [Deltaproteobacteria bacterium]
MCEANAYLIHADGTETLLMESVDRVIPEAGGLRLINIFGDQKCLKAAIHSLSLVDHKVYIQSLDT